MRHSGTGHRLDVDGLRAVAVVAVVLGHAGAPGFAGGFVGVDVFFVISGFLITGIIVGEIEQGRFSLASFYERRVRRIFPALFVMLAVITIVAAFVLLANDFRRFGRSLMATSVFGSNIFFASQLGYFDESAELKPLLHTWSLAVEEQFYLFLPLLLMAVGRWGGRRWKLAILLVAVPSFLLSLWLVARVPEDAFFMFRARAWELLMGSIIAVGGVPALTSRPVREAAAACGMGLIAVAIIAYTPTTPFPGAAALLPCLGAALLLHAGRFGPTTVGRALSLPPMVLVGLISYSLYLWHWPLLVLLRHWTVVDPTALQRTAAVALSFAAAWLSWRYVEQPFRQRQLAAHRRAMFASGAAATAGALAIGGLLILTNGWASRVPANVALLESAVSDMGEDARSCIAADTILNNQRCRLGVPDGAPSFILWGDSHANMLENSFDQLAQAAGLTGIRATSYACNPLLDDSPSRACAQLKASVQKLLDAHRVDTVILAGRWLRDDMAPERVAGTVAMLKQAGVRVVIVHQVPEQPHRGAATLARLAWNGMSTEALSITTEAYRQQFASRNGQLEAIGAALSATHVDLGEFLCDSAICPSTRDGQSLYRDGHHLSVFGATYVMPALQAALPTAEPTTVPPEPAPPPAADADAANVW